MTLVRFPKHRSMEPAERWSERFAIRPEWMTGPQAFLMVHKVDDAITNADDWRWFQEQVRRLYVLAQARIGTLPDIGTIARIEDPH